jgi:putative endonuclease
MGEVDIIARDRDRLAFVEVRARRGTAYGTPKESVTARKQSRLATVARHYLQEHGCSDIDWGIDVVAVQMTPRGTLQHIELIRNAVLEIG